MEKNLEDLAERMTKPKPKSDYELVDLRMLVWVSEPSDNGKKEVDAGWNQEENEKQ